MSYSACLQGAFSLGKQDCSPARGMVGTVEAAWHSGEELARGNSPKLRSLCSPANRMMCSMYLLLLEQVFSTTYFVTFTCFFLHYSFFFIITKVFNSYGSWTENIINMRCN